MNEQVKRGCGLLAEEQVEAEEDEEVEDDDDVELGAGLWLVLLRLLDSSGSPLT